MEAVPRLPMISFELLTTAEKVSFGPKLKQYIASFYQEDPESYNNEIHTLEGLRASAVWPTIDINNCQIMKKYYCQLHFLKSRFPMEENQVASVYFSWKDDYTKMSCSIPDINFELMSVLINIGAIHTKLGALDSRNSADGMKMSCTHFQCAAWAFQTVRETFGQLIGLIMFSNEQIRGMQLVCLAQAQECILEKSLLDNRKATIIAKIAVKLSDYYTQAFHAFQSGDEGFAAEHLPNHKYILQYLQFKIAYNNCIALLYQGQQAEEQQKMGERVAFYQAALNDLEDARKQMSRMSSSNQTAFKDTLAFTLDVVEGKRKAATNENEFIYHEDVPQIDSLAEVKGASLVKGIPFNIHDTEVSGSDIFGRLVPMEAHEASSMYSEQKAQMLRLIGERVERKDHELNEFMSSLQIDVLGQMKSASGLSQELVDRAASMVGRPNATKELIDAMGKLSDSYHEVEAMLNEIQGLLKEEETLEKEYQGIMGKRPPGIIATDLSREAAKYQEAHGKASESNQNLHKAMMTHVANLKILSQPLGQLRQQIPSLLLPDPNVDEVVVNQMEALVGKIEEMKVQRMNLWTQLRDGVHQDDITGALVTRQPNQTLESVFQQELEKHKKTSALIDQNCLAQENICKAIVEAYAKFTPTRKYLQDVLSRRNTTVSALIASHDTYDDLLAKANKGIEFYAKLETNVSKLLQRIKSACKVQEEEREQILIKNGHVKTVKVDDVVVSEDPVYVSNKPKLKDYLDSMKEKKGAEGYSTTSMYPQQDVANWGGARDNQEYVPSPSGYTQNYNTSVNSANYGSYGYTQVNYSDKNMDQALVDRMKGMKLPSSGEYDSVNAKAYNYPISVTPVTTYSIGATNLHTVGSPQVNTANYSVPRSVYQTVSTTNYPYITTSEQYAPDNTTLSTVGNNYVNYDRNVVTTTTPVATTNTTISYNATNYQDQNSYYGYNQQPVGSTYTQPQSKNQFYGYTPGTDSQGGYQYGNYDSSRFNTENPYGQTSSYTEKSTYQPQTTIPSYNANMSSYNTTYPQETKTKDVPPVVSHTLGYMYPQSNNPVLNQTQYNQDTNVQYPQTSIAYGSTTYQSNNIQYPITTTPNVNTINPAASNGTQLPVSTNVNGTQAIYNQSVGQPYANISAASNPVPYNQDSTLQYPTSTVTPKNQDVPTNQYSTPQTNLQYPQTGYSQYDSYSQNYYNQYGSSYQPTPSTNPTPSNTYQTTNNTPISNNYQSTNNTSTSQPPNNYQAIQPSNNYQPTNNTHSNEPTNYQSVNNTYTTQPTNNYQTSQPLSNYQSTQPTNSYQTAQPSSNYQTTQPSNNYQTNQPSSNYQTTQPTNNTQTNLNSQTTPKKESSIDLLAGLDFSIGQAPLIPQKEPKTKPSQPEVKEVVPPVKAEEKKPEPPKPSLIKKDKKLLKGEPFKNPETIKQFLLEVEKFEKHVESLNLKTLSGPSTLELKWKEIQDCQENLDPTKRSISVARCYPLKNQSPDILPYDYSRVELVTTRDDYINASHVKDTNPYCMDFIVTQTPLSSTIGDFWTMVWEQQVEMIVCMLSDAELKQDVYWPSEVGREVMMSAKSITLLSCTDKEFWVERKLNIAVPEMKESRVVTLLQFTSWPGSLFPTNPLPLVNFLKQIISNYNHQKHNGNPVLVHCAAGVGRSGIACILLSILMEFDAIACPFPDIVSAACKMSCSRKNILRDREHLKFVYVALLNYMLTLRRDFTKSDTEKAEEVVPVVNAVVDPLSTLDPLWATRKL